MRECCNAFIHTFNSACLREYTHAKNAISQERLQPSIQRIVREGWLNRSADNYSEQIVFGTVEGPDLANDYSNYGEC